MGWPVSTTHSIIGAIIGFACVSVGTEAVDWGSVQGIVGSWIITPENIALIVNPSNNFYLTIVAIWRDGF